MPSFRALRWTQRTGSFFLAIKGSDFPTHGIRNAPPPPNHREPTDTEGFHTEDVQQQTIFHLYALLSFFQQFTIFLRGACYTLQALIS